MDFVHPLKLVFQLTLVDFPGLGWIMTLCVAGTLPVGCQYQGNRACLQNFNFSSCKAKLSPLGHTMSKGNVPAEGTIDQALQGMCPFREEPHQMIHL